MKNIDSIFDFYIKNKLQEKERANEKVISVINALNDYIEKRNFDLSKVIKMIILDNNNINKLKNKNEIKALLEEFDMLATYESLEAKKCLEMAKNIELDKNNKELLDIYGRLLLTVAINIECNLKLDFNRLYEKIVKITEKEIENEKNIRMKYCHHCIHDVTEEYAYLITLLNEIVSKKINYNQELQEFDSKYENEKQLYRSMPILNGVLEKTKKAILL